MAETTTARPRDGATGQSDIIITDTEPRDGATGRSDIVRMEKESWEAGQSE